MSEVGQVAFGVGALPVIFRGELLDSTIAAAFCLASVSVLSNQPSYAQAKAGVVRSIA